MVLSYNIDPFYTKELYSRTAQPAVQGIGRGGSHSLGNVSTSERWWGKKNAEM